MSQSGQLLPAYLTPAAFEAASEIKDEKQSPYELGIECIEKYPKTGSEAEKKPFQDQFNQLLEEYTKWGIAHHLYDFGMDDNIYLMKSQFFHTGYSGSQNAEYFENIKKYLEKILLILQNEKISIHKRKIAYSELSKNLGRCAPGLDIHVKQAYFTLSSTLFISLNNWLSELRNNVIRYYADKYNRQHHISPGNSIHTIKPLTDYAAKQNWNPVYSTSNIQDKNTPQLTKEELNDFHNYFVSEYHAKAIRDCIQFNLHLELNNMFDLLGFNIKDDWKDSGHLNFTTFNNRASYLLKNLHVTSKDGIFDFLDSNDDFTQFRVCEDAIVNNICEQLFSPALYFDSIKKSYHPLIPAHWMNATYPLEMIDFSVWENIPEKDLSTVLCRVLKEMDANYIENLLENIPFEKLHHMNKDPSFAMTLSAVMNNTEKQTYILQKISKFLSLPEEKHAFFQPRENVLLDELLFNIANGAQLKAENIIALHPELLFMSSHVEAPSGDMFMDYSPVQLACYAHDTDMLKMMKRYASRVENGEEQFNTLIKQASMDANDHQTYDFNQLANIITHSSELEINAALDNFRKHFEPKYIKHQKSYNFQNFFNALEIYINHFDTWPSEKSHLFWCQVMGFLQRSLPACYAQVLGNQGSLFEVTQGNKIVTRKLLSFYPTLKNARSGLGYDYAIYDGAPLHSVLYKFQALPLKVRLEQYVKQKQQDFEKLSVSPTFSDLLNTAHASCPEGNKESYFYFLATLMKKHWGEKYKADHDGLCNEEGILTSESHDLIFAKFNQMVKEVKFTNDFFFGYSQVPKALRPEYVKLTLKQTQFFENFEIPYFARDLLSHILSEDMLGKSFLYYILTEQNPKIAKQFIRNAHGYKVKKIDDVWNNINIYKIFNLETERYYFDFILDRITPEFLACIIKEPHNNPFNNPTAKTCMGFDTIVLDKIGNKLTQEDLTNLILSADTDHYSLLTYFAVFLKLRSFLSASLLLKIFIVKDLLPKALDPAHNSSRAISLIVKLILEAARENQIENPEQLNALSYIIQKNMVYNGVPTNFLGYFIQRDNDAEDEDHYKSIFGLMSCQRVVDIYNGMGIENFAISLTLLDQIIHKFPMDKVSDIFKTNFTISDKMPKEKFARMLFNILANPHLNDDDIATLLARIPTDRIVEIIFDDNLCHYSLETITDSAIKVKVTKQLETFVKQKLNDFQKPSFISSSEEKLSAETMEKLADNFDRWMKTFTHPVRTHNQNLLTWISVDTGGEHIKNYRNFCELAVILSGSKYQYQTQPAPDETAFNTAFDNYCKNQELRKLMRDSHRRARSPSPPAFFENNVRPRVSLREEIKKDMRATSARSFDYWMKNFNHPVRTDNQHLLSWISTVSGNYINHYQDFCELALILSGSYRYATQPPPSETEFDKAIQDFDNNRAKRHQQRSVYP